MGLNRSEVLLLEYVQGHADERHHWQAKVQAIARTTRNKHEAAAALAIELRNYFRERTDSVKELGGIVRRENLENAMMRNLAEYLLQLWMPLSERTFSAKKI